MQKEVKRRIFEPFFTTKDPEKGTGMGLAAVYGTVKNHDGVVDVLSQVDKGTSFRIFFPTCDESVTTHEPSARQAAVNGAGNILVVDDEPMVLDMASEVLAQLGYMVTSCTSGTEALEIYRNTWQTTDLVVLDLILPEISGHEVLQSIRQINDKAKIVLCSGYSVDEEVSRLLDNDITDFVQKPFTMGALSQTVAKLLSNGQAAGS
jgi:two-component system cell cycle sensor histidine kinase/response regulator CckA